MCGPLPVEGPIARARQVPFKATHGPEPLLTDRAGAGYPLPSDAMT